MKVKAKLLGRELPVEEREDFAARTETDFKESFVVQKNEISVEENEVEDEEAKKEDPINNSKEEGGDIDDDKVDNELPDDDFFDAQAKKADKIEKAGQDSDRNMAKEENPDEVIGDFFDKPMTVRKAQMKIKKKFSKISK